MSWERIDPPYEFFQLVGWENTKTGKKLFIERQSGPDNRDWEVNLVDESGDEPRVNTLDTFTNEEAARQAAELFTGDDE